MTTVIVARHYDHEHLQLPFWLQENSDKQYRDPKDYYHTINKL